VLGREVLLQVSDNGGPAGVLVIDGPMRQPLLDYLSGNTATEKYDLPRPASAVELVPHDARVSFEELFPANRREAMRLAVTEASERERLAQEFIQDQPETRESPLLPAPSTASRPPSGLEPFDRASSARAVSGRDVPVRDRASSPARYKELPRSISASRMTREMPPADPAGYRNAVPAPRSAIRPQPPRPPTPSQPLSPSPLASSFGPLSGRGPVWVRSYSPAGVADGSSTPQPPPSGRTTPGAPPIPSRRFLARSWSSTGSPFASVGQDSRCIRLRSVSPSPARLVPQSTTVAGTESRTPIQQPSPARFRPNVASDPQPNGHRPAGAVSPKVCASQPSALTAPRSVWPGAGQARGTRAVSPEGSARRGPGSRPTQYARRDDRNGPYTQREAWLQLRAALVVLARDSSSDDSSVDRIADLAEAAVGRVLSGNEQSTNEELRAAKAEISALRMERDDFEARLRQIANADETQSTAPLGGPSVSELQDKVGALWKMLDDALLEKQEVEKELRRARQQVGSDPVG